MHPGTVQVVVGAPIDPAGKTVAEINAAAERWAANLCAACSSS